MYSRRLISRLDQTSTTRPSSSASIQRTSSRGVAQLLLPGTFALPALVKNPPCCSAFGSKPLRTMPSCIVRASKADSVDFGVVRKKAAIFASLTGYARPKCASSSISRMTMEPAALELADSIQSK